EFLEKGYKLKFSLQFRGRENAHRELGFEVVNRAIADCGDQASVDMAPRLVGRRIECLLSARAGKNAGKGGQEEPAGKAD
ncbi:MAG: translation initiation factor IF-3 C-terminal domain-containing protein, partial [Lentisphaerae bacterium]|nr:translation initiation factor IF-3 C-terminal domain-containing protein [Lentisphaerota bacterium]